MMPNFFPMVTAGDVNKPASKKYKYDTRQQCKLPDVCESGMSFPHIISPKTLTTERS